MKKILATLTPVYVFLSSGSFAFADVNVNPCKGADGISAALCKLDPANFGNMVSGLINAAFVIAVIVALGYLIYGGIRWIMSQGDKTKVENARNHVIAAVIGLVIVFMAYLIISVVLQIFTGKGFGDLTIQPINTSSNLDNYTPSN